MSTGWLYTQSLIAKHYGDRAMIDRLNQVREKPDTPMQEKQKIQREEKQTKKKQIHAQSLKEKKIERDLKRYTILPQPQKDHQQISYNRFALLLK
jgi:hypothetical protein